MPAGYYDPNEGSGGMLARLLAQAQSQQAPTRQPQEPQWTPWIQQHPKPELGQPDMAFLQSLMSGVGSGLDPSMAMSMAGQVTGSLDQDMAEWQARHDAFRQRQTEAYSTGADNLMQLAGTNPNPAAGDTYIDAYGQMPGVKPGVENRLGQLAETLYPGGGSSPLYMDPNAPTEADPLVDDEDTSAVMTLAGQAIASASQAGGPTDFQTLFWGTGEAPGLSQQITAAGAVGPKFDMMKEMLRQAWVRLGGTPDQAPQQQGMPPAQASAPAPAAPPVGNQVSPAPSYVVPSMRDLAFLQR